MYTYGIVSSEEEHKKSAALVDKVYGKSDYVNAEAESDFSIRNYLTNPDAITFVAREGERLVGTISVVNDGEMGLPLDMLFKEELRVFRQLGARITEVCQFAIDKNADVADSTKVTITPDDMTVTTELIGFAFHYALFKRTDCLCFTINPKHRSFYESLGCIQIGKEKAYAAVNNNPALAFVFNMRNILPESNHPIKSNWLIKRILQHPPDYQLFASSTGLLSYFYPVQIVKNILNRF